MILFLTACLPKRPGRSELLYGAMQDSNVPSAYLIHAKPDDTILFCGPYRSEAKKAFEGWAHAMGRFYTKLLEEETCSYQENIFIVETLRPQDSPEVKERCGQRKSLLMFAQPISFGIFGKKVILAVCKLDSQPVENQWSYSHEVGHMIGLCDQYDDVSEVGMHFKCSAKFRSRDGEYSAMNAGGTAVILDKYKFDPNVYMTSFDRTAARLIACRSDVDANSLWIRTYPSLVKEWREDKKFRDEVSRLSASGVGLLPECLGTATGSIEGVYQNRDGDNWIDCCICRYQNYQSINGIFTSLDSYGLPYYDISNIQNEKFEETTCFRRQGAASAVSKDRTRKIEVCKKVSVAGTQCFRNVNDPAVVPIKTGDVRQTLRPLGDGFYRLHE